ncbi:MAG: phosphatidylserine decarboxylase [Promethearchaeota archaeon]
MFAKGGKKFIVLTMALLITYPFWSDGFRTTFRIYWTGNLIFFAGFALFFFRDPRRKPLAPHGVLSPADGIVADIIRGTDSTIVYIEMHVRHVHVQRAPLGGRVTKVERIRGKHQKIYARFRKKEYSPEIPELITKNSRAIIELESEEVKVDGRAVRVYVTQISGKFARRCKPYVREGDIVQRGERVGVILFGSMVRFEIDGRHESRVRLGEKVKAGETVIFE